MNMKYIPVLSGVQKAYRRGEQVRPVAVETVRASKTYR